MIFAHALHDKGCDIFFYLEKDKQQAEMNSDKKRINSKNIVLVRKPTIDEVELPSTSHFHHLVMPLILTLFDLI